MKFLKSYKIWENRFETIESEKQFINDVVDNCKDILLEASDLGGEVQVTRGLNLNEDFFIKCRIILSYRTGDMPFLKYKEFWKKLEETEVWDRLCEYMKMQGFKEINNYKKPVNVMNPNTFQNEYYIQVSFKREMSSDYIGHLRYLKKYKIKSNEND